MSDTTNNNPPTTPNSATPKIRFNFPCRLCSSILESTNQQSGKEGKCPTCGAVFLIPHIDPKTGMAIGEVKNKEEYVDPVPVHAYAAAGNCAPALIKTSSNEYCIKCPRCNTASHVEANLCLRCGYPFTIEGANRAASNTNDGFAVLSFLIGLISFPVCICTYYGGIGAFISLALGWSSLNRIEESSQSRKGRGLAVTGIVLSCCGLFFTILRIML